MTHLLLIALLTVGDAPRVTPLTPTKTPVPEYADPYQDVRLIAAISMSLAFGVATGALAMCMALQCFGDGRAR